ncbi:MAG: type II secretion system minor pseudopilin GspI, partial [Parvularculaceae bacterium]|nr:type II secretion system minor pseudopilin GspI [Parvularculaceae bacterium]
MTGRMRGGFTLIEVLVALAILSVVIVAAIALVAQSTRLVAQSEKRLYASIVADNAMADALARVDAALGDEESEVDLAGGKWTVVRTVTKLEGLGASRVDLAVRRAGDAQTLVRISTVLRT